MKLLYHSINKIYHLTKLSGFKPGVVFMLIEEGKLPLGILTGMQFD